MSSLILSTTFVCQTFSIHIFHICSSHEIMPYQKKVISLSLSHIVQPRAICCVPLSFRRNKMLSLEHRQLRFQSSWLKSQIGMRMKSRIVIKPIFDGVSVYANESNCFFSFFLSVWSHLFFDVYFIFRFHFVLVFGSFFAHPFRSIVVWHTMMRQIK